MKKIFKYKIIINIFYFVLIYFIYYVIKLIGKSEIINFITAFVVIDISNSEKRNLELNTSRIRFYDSITIACKGILSGFVAPLLYIVCFSNALGIIYFIIYNLNEIGGYDIFEILYTVLSIIPSLIIQVFFYFIYISRNKRLQIDFKGDYITNILTKPLLNLEIMAAYIESVNFYYHFEKDSMNYVKSYGSYNNKIDEYCIKDYLSIIYGLSFLFFAFFMIIVYFLK
ncbi:hypothetical protein [Clostridium amazonitimonense]|uniref:hypothetical protein n=1 Tax=Clostridium amazonitimonense TaxID=1499689 RepID=UPI00164D0AFE|nr:hypothetical protein [Clostridium amazonitimonense]